MQQPLRQRAQGGRAGLSASLAFALALVSASFSGGAARAAEPLFSHELPRFRSGAELLADCSAKDPAARGRCHGYIMAIADVLGGAGARVDGIQACLKGDESLEELVATVDRHLQENPARQALKGDGAAAYALALYRPCVAN